MRSSPIYRNKKKAIGTPGSRARESPIRGYHGTP